MNSPMFRKDPCHGPSMVRGELGRNAPGSGSSSRGFPPAAPVSCYSCTICNLRRALKRNAICMECRAFMQKLVKIVGHRKGSERFFQGCPIRREERIQRYRDLAAVGKPLFNDVSPADRISGRLAIGGDS